MNNFIKTLFRGLLLIIPLFALVYLLRKLQTEVGDVVTTIIKQTPLESKQQVFSVAFISVIVVLLLSYLAGLLSKTAVFRKASRWVDGELIENSRLYRSFKLNFDNNIQFLLEDKPPVFVQFGSAERPGFLIEQRNEEKKSIVFIPKNIYNHDGHIYIVDQNQVRLAKQTSEDFTYSFMHLGVGMDIE